MAGRPPELLDAGLARSRRTRRRMIGCGGGVQGHPPMVGIRQGAAGVRPAHPSAGWASAGSGGRPTVLRGGAVPSPGRRVGPDAASWGAVAAAGCVGPAGCSGRTGIRPPVRRRRAGRNPAGPRRRRGTVRRLRSARSKWRSTSAHTSGSSGPRSSSESGARARITAATTSRVIRNESLDTKPAICWSVSGRQPDDVGGRGRRPGTAAVGDEDEDEREEDGDDRLGHQVDGPDHRSRAGDARDPADDRQPQHDARPPGRPGPAAPRTAAECDWAATSGRRHRPDQHDRHRDDGRRRPDAAGAAAASIGAGPGRPCEHVVGQPGQQQRGHRQDQDAPLEHQGRQRPVGGEVAERPPHGDEGHAPGRRRTGGSAPAATASGWSAAAEQATVQERHADAEGRPARPTGPDGGARPTADGGHRGHGGIPFPLVRRLAGMATPDRLERVTDLLLVLLDTNRPLSLREIAERVPGYPDRHDARRQAFERDKKLLRDEGVPVVTGARRSPTTRSATGSTPTPTTSPTWASSPTSRLP